MSAWGYEALESDEGLDVLDCIFDAKQEKWSLSGMFEYLREREYLPENPDETDFMYDITYMALAEMLIEYTEDGSLPYETSDAQNNEETLYITSISYANADLQLLIDGLTKLVAPQGDPNELYQMWADSEGIDSDEGADTFEDWKNHVRALIDYLINLKS